MIIWCWLSDIKRCVSSHGYVNWSSLLFENLFIKPPAGLLAECKDKGRIVIAKIKMISACFRELLYPSFFHLRTTSDTSSVSCAQITNAHQCRVICFYYSLILYRFECPFIIFNCYFNNLRVLLQTVSLMILCHIIRYIWSFFRRTFFKCLWDIFVNAKHHVVIIVLLWKQLHKFFELNAFEQRCSLSINNAKYKFPQHKQPPIVDKRAVIILGLVLIDKALDLFMV